MSRLVTTFRCKEFDKKFKNQQYKFLGFEQIAETQCTIYKRYATNFRYANSEKCIYCKKYTYQCPVSFCPAKLIFFSKMFI